MTYKWGSQSFPVDPNVAAAELKRIGIKEGGASDAAEILDAARPKKAKLHPAFTWDDTKAAEAWRRQEARSLSNSLIEVEVNQDGESIERPAFYHVDYINAEDQRVAGYQATSVVVSDARARDSAALTLIAHLEGLRKRHESLEQFESVWREVDQVALELAA